tara:strand:- start:29 stop:409 length:381 start_codon:yes stop_codon:yes gene_type:complete
VGVAVGFGVAVGTGVGVGAAVGAGAGVGFWLLAAFVAVGGASVFAGCGVAVGIGAGLAVLVGSAFVGWALTVVAVGCTCSSSESPPPEHATMKLKRLTEIIAKKASLNRLDDKSEDPLMLTLTLHN